MLPVTPEPTTSHLAADLLRLFAGVTILTFASWTDWRWRRAPNALWPAMGAVGIVALAIDLWDQPALRDATPYLVAIPVIVAVLYGFWYIGLIAGGADAKALMALAFLVPWPVTLGPLPLLPSVLPGSLTILGNSLLAAMLIPVALFLLNAAKGRLRLPHAFLGYTLPLTDLGVRPEWPMERVEEGRVVSTFFASRRGEADWPEVREAFAGAGRDHVWVTPKIPFMVPLLVGFVTAFVAGDLLYGFIELVAT